MIVPGLLTAAACSRLLDFSDVTGGAVDAGDDAAADGSGGEGGAAAGGSSGAGGSATGGGGSAGAGGSGGAGGSSGCAAALTDCGGTCVDTASDSEHCGMCNRSCGGGDCEASDCKPVRLGEEIGCHSVAIDGAGTYAYITRLAGGGGVYRVDLSTGTTTAVATGYAQSVWIELAGNAVFWTTEQMDGAVWKVELTSGATPVKVYPNSGDPTMRQPFGLTVADGFVYFADKTGVIGRIPEAGTTSEILYTGLGKLLTLDVLGSWIYYVERTADVVNRVPLMPPGSPQPILTSIEKPWGVIAREVTQEAGLVTNVYASTQGGMVIAGGQTNGMFSTIRVTNGGVAMPGAAEIISVGDQLFWANRPISTGGGSIQTYRLGALGNGTVVASAKRATGLAHADGFLYWCALDSGLVRLRL